MKTDPPKLSEIQVGHPAPATRAAYRATDERRLRQSASSPGLPAVPQLQARPTASTSPVSRRAFETRARTPDGGGKLIVAIRPPSQPALRSPASKPLRSPPSAAARLVPSRSLCRHRWRRGRTASTNAPCDVARGAQPPQPAAGLPLGRARSSSAAPAAVGTRHTGRRR